MRRLLAALIVVVTAVGTQPAAAGSLDRAAVQSRLGAEVMVGERDPRLPLWPVFRRVSAAPELVAHAFETADLEPVSGYGGKPINLLVLLDREGRVLQVHLLTHAEPIFRSPAGDALLGRFARQYEQLTLQHQVQVLTPKAERRVTDTTATLHGITAGTVTALAIDRSIMEAAAQAAIALAGGAVSTTGADDGGVDDRYQRTGWNALVGAGLVQRIEIHNRAVQSRFVGSPGATLDAEGMVRPDGLAVDVWVALLGLPQVGRNLLDRAGWHHVRALREDGVQTLLLLDDSRYPLGADGTRSTQVVARQGGREIRFEPLARTLALQKTGQRSGVGVNASVRQWRTAEGARLDMAEPFELVLTLQRRDSDGRPIVAPGTWTHRYAPAGLEAFQPVREQPAWMAAWQTRTFDIAVLLAGLAVLTAALARQRWLAARPARLATFRVVYLVFTLGFIGWVAQGQLTIVNATALIEAQRAGRRLDFLLTDPMAVILWAYVGVALFIWGRGTFCGWLCPFGALQELVSLVARKLGWRERRLKLRTDHALKKIKYGVLAVIVIAAFVSEPWTERLVEVEPFKTSISLMFRREAIYVAWALLCLGATLWVFRAYCRYLCPLGAGLALLGRVRLLRWIPRRAECGTPCQTCRHRCDYQAIEPSGAVSYGECFQCLDCVELHDDATRCMPLIREHKGRRVIALAPQPS